ncbi:MAG: prolyl oligopeptidase family serine peptidase [Candidatus Endonucleobacter bathymodioli]|uniref:Prolyl oligopeptidase family serine peptidase n=1 Tax=Candidatus Endonucleibacter bathymodioli TaxID=539814 RepID=A0AA90NPB0_9GAMM|nr:prolyl oligopeptidase family serine peptidase [Candidatus Endonucleobacter bathymodioli]
MKPPSALKIPMATTQHGHQRVDNYHWLRDTNWQKIIEGDLTFANSEIPAHLKTEEAYKKSIMHDYKATEKILYDEILSRIKEDDKSYPIKKGDYFYYSRLETGKNYALLCRKHLLLSAREEIYFDINKEASGKDLYLFGPSCTNKAETFLAYGFNLSGSLERIIKIRDLASGNDLEWTFPNSTGSFLWLDNDSLYIVERDKHSRGKNIYRINIHKGPDEKKLIFSKPEIYDNSTLYLSQTTDKLYIQAYIDTSSTHTIFSSKKGSDKFYKLAKGENDTSFTIDHYQDNFYILTNLDNCHNFKVMTCPVSQEKWGREHWNEFLPEQKNSCLENISFYNHYLILDKKDNGKALNEIAVFDMNTKKTTTISMPDEAYDIELFGDHNHLSTVVRLDYNSPTSPDKVLELNLETCQVTQRHVRFIPNFDPSTYTVKREFATARDGEKIPITIVHKKDLELNGKNKALVYGYGSYGYGIPADFSSPIFSLINRGFVYTVAHIRGGNDKGFTWYLDGKMHKKMNTFYDFIDSCEYLINKNYTSKGNIAINGGSAGGLLMGAVTNLRPDLFDCVISDVAFVDVINTISDKNLPLTPPEWEEWGNPITNKEDFQYILQYSPYDNIQETSYPPMLFNSGISDEQVTYWEPTKMVAKLRELKTDNNILLLNMKMHAGHSGASKRYEWIEETAFNYAFILKCFGIQ